MEFTKTKNKKINVDKIQNRSTNHPNLLTYNQMKMKVGDAWALIYNPVFSEKTGKLLKGELIDFDANEKKLLNIVSNNKTKGLHFTIRWFGKIPEDKILLNFF